MSTKVMQERIADCFKTSQSVRPFVSIILLFVLLPLFLSCTTKQRNNIGNGGTDTIFVSYYPYTFESNQRVTCLSLSESSAIHQVDSIIYLPYEYFDKIAQFIQSHETISKNEGCDSRICVEYGSSEICIGGIGSCLCDINDTNLQDVPEIIYIIKWKSGYFSYFNESDLSYDKTIEIFGIPKDYMYKREENIDDNNNIRKLGLRKIAFIADK